MEWLNTVGIVIVVLILLPYIIRLLRKPIAACLFAKVSLIFLLGRIGFLGALVLMVLNIPTLVTGFFFVGAAFLYRSVIGVLLIAYFIWWIITLARHAAIHSVTMSLIPCLIFVFTGAMVLNIPLLILGAVALIGCLAEMANPVK